VSAFVTATPIADKNCYALRKRSSQLIIHVRMH
jgi:hypothetical protein